MTPFLEGFLEELLMTSMMQLSSLMRISLTQYPTANALLK